MLLEAQDVDTLRQYGFCVVRSGLVGPESKTWVKLDTLIDTPLAEIDDGNDLNIYVPKNAILPMTIGHEAINAISRWRN